RASSWSSAHLHPPGVPQQTGQTLQVPIDPEVVVVALQATPEPGVLRRHFLVPLAAAPGVDGLDGPSQTRTPRLACQPPTPLPGSPPVQREPQEVEGGRTFAVLLPQRRPLEWHQAGLVPGGGQP